MSTENGYCNGYTNGFVNGDSCEMVSSIADDNGGCDDIMNNFDAKLNCETAKKTVLERISTVTKPGITREEVVDQYSDWVENSNYEQVR